MDSQLCTLEIESYGYTMADLVYFWNDGKSVEMNPTVSLAEFHVVGYRQRRVLEVLTSGNYSRLCADILFSRQEYDYQLQLWSSFTWQCTLRHIQTDSDRFKQC